MATVTLVESAKLAQNDFTAGVIENVITVDKFYQVLPFMAIQGNALQYTRENALGPVATTGVGNSDGVIGAGASGTNQTERLAAKNAATFTSVTASLTTIMGDAEVNGMVQATRSGDGNDQTAIQIASKAKSSGRKFADMLINGDGSNFSFPGLLALCAAGQEVATATNGSPLSFTLMDEMMDLVTDKDGAVDYMTFHSRTIRSYKALLRGLGGASINETITLPSGDKVPVYEGCPIFRNDYIPVNQTQGSGTALTTIFAGTWDDGARQNGIAGLTAEDHAGLHVEDVGISESKDERIWRVKWYVGLALFSEKGLAMTQGISN